MLKKEEVLLIIYFIAIIFFLVVFVVMFFIAFQRRKNRFLIERLEAQQKFKEELANSQLEIQEQTFKNIAWELHDNVGQLLSVANLQLNMLMNTPSEITQDQIKETKDVIVTTVEEVRSLSKTLNTEVILNNGLVKSIEVELERFNRLNFLQTELKIEGNEQTLKNEDEIFIFRIVQEFFSNVIKHSRANKLFVHLYYKNDNLEITVSDDGAGFDTEQKKFSSGLQNMKSRAELIGAQFELNSKIDEGTTLQLIYTYPFDE
jgi:signal transduction histidine kinase